MNPTTISKSTNRFYSGTKTAPISKGPNRSYSGPKTTTKSSSYSGSSLSMNPIYEPDDVQHYVLPSYDLATQDSYSKDLKKKMDQKFTERQKLEVTRQALFPLLDAQEMTVIPIEKDGSCMFSALAHYIPGKTAKELRKEAVTLVSEKWSIYGSSNSYGSKANYINEMKNPLTFGEQPEIEELAKKYNLRIIILNGDDITLVNPTGNKLAYLLLQNEHYDVIIPDSSISKSDYKKMVDWSLLDPDVSDDANIDLFTLESKFMKKLIETNPNLGRIKQYNGYLWPTQRGADFFLASEQGNLQKCQEIIDKAITVDGQMAPMLVLLESQMLNYEQRNALHIATQLGNKEMVDYINRIIKYFYPEGSDLSIIGDSLVNMVDFNGETPLMIAARDSDLDLVRFLLSEGADISIQNMNGQTAIDVADWELSQQQVQINGIVRAFLKANKFAPKPNSTIIKRNVDIHRKVFEPLEAIQDEGILSIMKILGVILLGVSIYSMYTTDSSKINVAKRTLQKAKAFEPVKDFEPGSLEFRGNARLDARRAKQATKLSQAREKSEALTDMIMRRDARLEARRAKQAIQLSKALEKSEALSDMISRGDARLEARRAKDADWNDHAHRILGRNLRLGDRLKARQIKTAKQLDEATAKATKLKGEIIDKAKKDLLQRAEIAAKKGALVSPQETLSKLKQADKLARSGLKKDFRVAIDQVGLTARDYREGISNAAIKVVELSKEIGEKYPSGYLWNPAGKAQKIAQLNKALKNFGDIYNAPVPKDWVKGAEKGYAEVSRQYALEHGEFALVSVVTLALALAREPSYINLMHALFN